MTETVNYLWCALAGVLGMAFHLFAIKLPSAMERAKKANINLTMGQYISTEWVSIGANLFSISIALVILSEALNYKPEMGNWLKIIFVFYGFTGSSILLSILGKVGKQINSIVDIKTNIADEVTTQEGISPVTELKPTPEIKP